jgi:predicted aspartyl protease
MNYSIEIRGSKHSNLYIDKTDLVEKLMFNIYPINNNYYILENFIKELSKDDYKWNWLKNNLFDTGYNTILKKDIMNKTIKYKNLPHIKLLFHNKNQKLFELKSFIAEFELEYLIQLIKSKNLEDDIIKLCGTKNKEEQEYYRFIFKNIEFTFINYQSDIDRLKEYYNNKIKELEQKIKTLEKN